MDIRDENNENDTYYYVNTSLVQDNFVVYDESALNDPELKEIIIDPSRLIFEEKIGGGFFGVIHRGYLICNANERKEIALKRIVLNHFRSLDQFNLFMKEVNIWRKLDHKYIVKLLGVSLDNDRVMVTEYLEGGNLSTLIKTRPHEVTKGDFRLRISKCIAHALDYLHRNDPPVIHRDLTPSNVLLTKDLQIAKVADFGLSRVLNKEGNMTSAIGSCVYMAPEVFRGGAYDEKADVYSFSLILWTLWTLKDPEEGKHPQMWATLVASEGLRPKLYDCIPNIWKELITKCWNQDPSERPSFAEIIQYLNEIEKV